MKGNLQFDFSVNKENKTINLAREFAADVVLVWKAWTTPELLDQWWGPQPWRAETKTMDFTEGGYWLYAMVSPEGERHWAKASYITIAPEKSFTAKDAFCDENGTINTDFPQNTWENVFTGANGNTTVNITLQFDKLEHLEQTIAMGFKEGFTTGLNQLDELLPTLKK
ncbi:MAG: SRPBCC family protein [Flavobacterium sp.]